MAEVRLFVALGHNRTDFQWDLPGNRPLILRHLAWCLEQEERGWLIGAGPLGLGDPDGTVLADGLTIFATTSRAELDRVLDTDPLVRADVRHYAVTSWLLNQAVARDCAGDALRYRAG
jgi:uncharacterized protein YciI